VPRLEKRELFLSFDALSNNTGTHCALLRGNRNLMCRKGDVPTVSRSKLVGSGKERIDAGRSLKFCAAVR
jgi:hypothetical protein